MPMVIAGVILASVYVATNSKVGAASKTGYFLVVGGICLATFLLGVL